MTHEASTQATRPLVDETCLSDRVLDELVAGRAKSESENRHLDGCERCQERARLFLELHDGAAPTVERLIARASQQRAPGPRLLKPAWLGGLGFAAAASVALVVLTPGPDARDEGIRAKGASMRFVVQRQGHIIKGVSGDAFRAGDALRFLVSSDTRRHFFLVGIEETGEVSAYYPYGGESSVELGPAIDFALPGSLVLDSSQATEYFLGLFSAEPLTLSEIEAAVADVREQLGASLETLRQLELPGSHHWVVVHKE